MMDHMLMGAYGGSLLGDAAYRCYRCGQGPVTASEGFLTAYCLNCGTYHAPRWDWPETSSELGIGRIVRAAKDKLFARLKRLFCRRREELSGA